MDFATLWKVTLSLLEGFGVTLEIFALTLLFALPLGLVIAFGSMSRFSPIKYASKFLVWVIRGTPLMLQVIVIFYGPGLLANWAEGLGSTNAVIQWLATLEGFDRFPAVIISFVINYACYFSEIYRGGIESIPHGQYEAGQVLGMTKSQIFFKIILFQVIKRIVAPMGNEIITLVKDTSLARVVTVVELVKAAEDIVSMNGIIWPLFYIAVFYLLFSGLLTILLGRIEKKLNYYSG